MATMAELMAAEAARRAEAERQAAIAKRRAELAERERARLYQVAQTGSSAPTPVSSAPALPTPGSMYTPPAPIAPPTLQRPDAIQTPISPTSPMPGSTTVGIGNTTPRYVVPPYYAQLPLYGIEREKALERNRLSAPLSGPVADYRYDPFKDSAFSTMGPKPNTTPPAGYEWRAKVLTMTDGTKRAIWAIEPVSKVSLTGEMRDLPASPSAQDYYADYNSGGGGGYGDYGGGGGGGGGEVTPPEPLGELSWWATGDSIQPLLRNWASWMHDLVEANRLTSPVPNPFVFDPEAEAAYAKLDKEKGPVAPGFRSSKDVLGRLQTLLGVNFGEEETKTQQWQKVVDAIPTAGLEAQQLLTSLRFDPNSARWYSVDVPMLVNERYL